MENIHNTDINENIPFWKFSECASQYPPKIEGTIENFLKKVMLNPFAFGFHNLKELGIYKIHGWAFDFSGYLKRYVYKTSCGIQEGYFLNKSNIRKIAGTRIIYIKEI